MRKRNPISILLLVTFTLTFSCTYNEQKIIADNNIKIRKIYVEGITYSINKTKELKYIDYFDNSGFLKKREFVQQQGRYNIFQYDSIGNKVSERFFNNNREGEPRLFRYDNNNNLISEKIILNVTKYKNYYFDDKLQMVEKFNNYNKIGKIFIYNYDWKGRVLKEFQIDNSSHGKINKIIFDYDLSGKLKEKMVYQAKLKSKPQITNESINIFNKNYPPEFYKLKNTYKYIYNDLGLLSAEIELSPIGFEIHKSSYQYVN